MNPHDHRPGDPSSLHPSGIEERLWHKAAGVALVELAQVSSAYGEIFALQNVSLKIWPGQFMAIVGPNGGGKTTLLRTILGMVPVNSGHVLMRGESSSRSSLQRIGYVPQLETIDWNFPITVEEVITMGFFVKNRWLGGIGDSEKRKLYNIMERLNLSGLGTRHIRELSGGQQQAVFIGRALVGDPELILLDEPAAGVNRTLLNELLDAVRRLRDQGKTVLLVEHDMKVVMGLCETVFVLDHGEKLAEGAPGVIQADERVIEAYFGR